MWLHVPNTPAGSSPSSPGSAGSISASAQDWAEPVARSCTWNGKLSLPRYWRRRWKSAPWMRRLSGLTLPPSTTARIAAEFAASLPASPARPCPLRASGKGRSTPAGSGRNASAHFAKLTPTGDFLKTSGDSYLPTMEPPSEIFSGTWPRSGSMRSGSLYERSTLARRTGGNGSSCWPTARGEDAEGDS